jgi:hypothetical protein
MNYTNEDEDAFYIWRIKQRLNNLSNKKEFQWTNWHSLGVICLFGIGCNLPISNNMQTLKVEGKIYTPAEIVYETPLDSEIKEEKVPQAVFTTIPHESPYKKEKQAVEKVEIQKEETKENFSSPYITKTTKKEKKTNSEIALEFFESKGYTKHHAAAVVGNLICESGLRTKAIGDGGKAYGIAQWHPNRQRRFKHVFGKDIRKANLIEQLEFVHWELNNTEKKAYKKFIASSNVHDAASLFDKHYERSSGAARKTRISLAKQLLKTLTD